MCSIFLIKPQRQKTALFATKYQLKRVNVARHSTVYATYLMNRKDKSFKLTAFLSE